MVGEGRWERRREERRGGQDVQEQLEEVTKRFNDRNKEVSELSSTLTRITGKRGGEEMREEGRERGGMLMRGERRGGVERGGYVEGKRAEGRRGEGSWR
eukprot:762080-Hanusia_phi.AAC.4